MTEINDWIPVKGYEGLYEVSGILGKVRSLNYNKTGKVKILKGNLQKTGYILHGLCKNGKRKCYLEHRIVAEHFNPNPLNKPCINHLNEDKTDNRSCNLSWTTIEENNNYGTHNERVAEAKRGVLNTPSSKPVLQFTMEGEFVREWHSEHECARNGFNQGNVSACCRGEQKQHKGYIWKFKL